MRIEAVTICMNYGDFLAHSMPLNMNHFDNWIIVTEPKDHHTQDICRYYGVNYIKTHEANLHKGEFRKGECITIGLNQLEKTDWLLLIDADTVLQPNFRKVMESLSFNESLDKSCIYTIDRVRFETFEEWMEFYNNPSKNLGNRPRDGRFCLPNFVPTGFFQMWHSSTGIFQYIHQWVTVGGEDIRFSYLWPRNKRVFIPETTCYHLASSPECNWTGRVSKPFKIDRGEENERFTNGKSELDRW
jgi:hypothetical protein